MDICWAEHWASGQSATTTWKCVRSYPARTLGLQTSPLRLQLPQVTLLPPWPPSLLSLLQPPVWQLQPSPPLLLLLHLLHLQLEIFMDGPQAIGLSRSWTMNPLRRLATAAANETTSSSAGISTLPLGFIANSCFWSFLLPNLHILGFITLCRSHQLTDSQGSNWMDIAHFTI